MKTIFAFFLFGLSFGFLHGAGAKEKTAAPKSESANLQREKMAVAHEKMAACLRSEKSIEQCHAEMQSSCRTESGESFCPMHPHMHGAMRPGPKGAGSKSH